MTNKINSLLAIFMALFLFSCAADPVVEMKPPPSMGDKNAYDTFFDAQRDIIDGPTGDTAWKTSVTPTAAELTGKYIITELGTTGKYISLYIKPITEKPAGYSNDLGPNYDLNYASGSSIDAVRANSKLDSYYDPRKLLTDKGDSGKVRIAWSGRVGKIPEIEADKPFEIYNGYNKYNKAAGSGGGYGIQGVWTIKNHSEPKPLVGRDNKIIDRYLISTDGKTGSHKVRAWSWYIDAAINKHPNVVNNYSFVAPNNILFFGYGTDGYKDKEPRPGTGDWEAELNDKGSPVDGKINNVNPPGKMIFARKFGNKTAWIQHSAVFLTTVVGYNIRTKVIPLANLTPLKLPDGATAKEFYMEFDAGSYLDAKADGYDEAENFPYWKGLNDQGDGVSVEGDKRVQKFTGILLTM